MTLWENWPNRSYIIMNNNLLWSGQSVYLTGMHLLQSWQDLPAADCDPCGGWVKPTAPDGGADAAA
jgi:hypothetical protein